MDAGAVLIGIGGKQRVALAEIPGDKGDGRTGNHRVHPDDAICHPIHLFRVIQAVLHRRQIVFHSHLDGVQDVIDLLVCIVKHLLGSHFGFSHYSSHNEEVDDISYSSEDERDNQEDPECQPASERRTRIPFEYIHSTQLL